ncbi:Fungalysin metallopeptidase-domain-containing protein [Boletus coccyginus]|nr:Fungalysin metallopeptidase-domain-containing protein [Boletus coccyginus]
MFPLAPFPSLVGRLFGECLCNAEFATLPQTTRDNVVKNIGKHTIPTNIVPLLIAARHAIKKLGAAIDAWADISREMVLAAQKLIDEVCFKQSEWVEMLEDDGVVFEDGDSELGHGGPQEKGKQTLRWVQVPTKHGVKLELDHRFEVEMEHNWYETTVMASLPHHIISTIDWASDSLILMRVTEKGVVAHIITFQTWVLSFVQGPSLTQSLLHLEGGAKGDLVKHSLNKRSYPSTPKHPQVPETSKTLYLVFPWRTNDPNEAAIKKAASCGESTGVKYPLAYGRELVKELSDTHASPAGWHTLPCPNDPSTSEGDAASYSGLAFAYPYSPQAADNEIESLEQARGHFNATITQLFYTTNMVHDFYYHYGFTEAAGNFQQPNFEGGGEENNAVIANAQDGNSEAGIVIHELTCGLSTRLTGGPKNSGCLGLEEAGGMDEGWGDFIATSIHSTSTYSDYPMGAWATNRGDGIRNYPYSISKKINPLTYKTLDKPGYWGVHAIDKVWAEMLWVMQQQFIAKHGFSMALSPLVPDADGTLPPNNFYRPQTFNSLTGSPNPLAPKHGNILLLQLVINGTKMQPCSPSFFDARDVTIEADKVLTGGENLYDLWEGFVERGLDIDALVVSSTPWGGGVHTNGIRVPSQCWPGQPQPEPKPKPKPMPSDSDCDPIFP